MRGEQRIPRAFRLQEMWKLRWNVLPGLGGKVTQDVGHCRFSIPDKGALSVRPNRLQNTGAKA